MKLKLYFLKNYPDGIGLPSYATSGSAGFDVRSVEDLTIKVGETKLVHLGITAKIPAGYEIQLRSRSGLALKKNVFLMNGVGTIDSDYYPNEWGAIVHNGGTEDFIIEAGDRIAQAVLCKLPKVTLERIYEDPVETAENDRKGGFGSTGVK